MDAKANTHICESPLTPSESEERRSIPQSAYLIVVEGGVPGMMLPLSPEGTTLGRSPENDVPFSDPTVSRRHAIVSIDWTGSVHIMDTGSTNGTFLNGRRLPPQRPRRVGTGDRIRLGTKVVLKLVRLDPTDERFQRDLFERTVRDSLTGLYNRMYFLEQIRNMAEHDVENGDGLAVLMLDVDHFKRVNDEHGHLAGDAVLREMAAVLRESTRSEDLVARFGGEEFVISLPVSAADVAADRAERIRRNIADRRILFNGQELRVTASLGLAFSPPGRSRQVPTLVTVADQALYQAKADGRNRVVFGSYLDSTAPKETKSAVFPLFV